MSTQPPIEQAPSSIVAPRSARRATARRASTRRATARRRQDDLEERIRRHRRHHPQSTIGDMAKALDTDRATVAAGLSHMARAGTSTVRREGA
jgi:hypothetical protein